MDPTNPDTDGGGVPDGQEIIEENDPLLISDDDTDGDGILNLDEIAWGMNPLKVDSNNDCISDTDEINLTGGLPGDFDNDGIYDVLDNDNDNDGISDCEELKLGTDPYSVDAQIQGSGGCGISANASTKHHKALRGWDLSLFFLLLPIFSLFIVRRIKARKS